MQLIKDKVAIVTGASRGPGFEISKEFAGKGASYPFDSSIWNKMLYELPKEDFDRVIEVDLKGTMRLTQAVIRYMIRNGSNGGVIINITSIPGIAGHTAAAPYGIAKSTVIAITKYIPIDYGDRNIRGYTLALANISAEATLASMTPPERKKAAIENSMKRGGHPQEVSRIAANLASEDFAFATGTIIVMDRGMMMML